MSAGYTAQTLAGYELKPVTVWPALTSKELCRIEKGLRENILSDQGAEVVFAQEVERTRLWLPVFSSSNEGNPHTLLDYTEFVASLLGRKEFRFGKRIMDYLVGFSEELSRDEARLCNENYLLQRVGKRTQPDAVINADGSIAYTYRTDLYKSDRFGLLSKRMFEIIGPQLDGVVGSSHLTLLNNDGWSSLFSTKPPENLSEDAAATAA